MKYLFMLLLLLPLNLWAAWDVDLGLAVDGENFKAEHQKFEDGKEKAVQLGNYILKVTFKKEKTKADLDVLYKLHEKKGKDLILVTQGDDEIDQKLNKEIFAKGEEKQPNTIITLKLKNL